MLAIFQYDFMIRAFIAGAIIGILAPTIGIFLVVKRYSLLADTLAHVSLVGVAAGVLLGINPIMGALVTSVVAAFGMERLRARKKIYGESILALFLSGSLAVALILLGLAHGLNVNIFSFLFGSITTVSATDLIIIGAFGILAISLILIFFKSFFLVSYDEELAQAQKLPVTLLNIIIIVMAAITVSISIQVVGILLVGALMVIPVLSATQWEMGFLKTALLSTAFSLIAVVTGLFLSFYLNLPSGGTIVVTALFIFAISLFFNKK